MSSDTGARGGAGIGMTLMAAASPLISPNRSAVRRGFTTPPGVGEPRRRVRKDVVQGGDVAHLDEVVVRNPGLNVDGLGEDQPRREEELPGQELLSRQRAAGGGGNQGNRGVFSAEASETRRVPVPRRQRRDRNKE